MGPFISAILISLVLSASAVAAPKPGKSPALSQELRSIRGSILGLEKELITSLKDRRQAKRRLRKLRTLLALQKKERRLSQKRIDQIEDFVADLENRKGLLKKRIHHQQEAIRDYLKNFSRSLKRVPREFPLAEQERLEAPRRYVLRQLVQKSAREIEALRVDFVDAQQLEERIEEERAQLVYLFQDLKEQESLLEFHKRFQLGILRKNYQDRLSQLQHYRKLKSAEGEVQALIEQFNARLEFERIAEQERQVAKSMFIGDFNALKGKLPFPVMGKVVGRFGKVVDPKSQLRIFKKGIEIASPRGADVLAVAPGKVVFSGKLSSFGNVTIIDHGASYFSLCAHLGELKLKPGVYVARGEPIGITDRKGKPLYFEIRHRNIAVNPLQWLMN